MSGEDRKPRGGLQFFARSPRHNRNVVIELDTMVTTETKPGTEQGPSPDSNDGAAAERRWASGGELLASAKYSEEIIKAKEDKVGGLRRVSEVAWRSLACLPVECVKFASRPRLIGRLLFALPHQHIPLQ